MYLVALWTRYGKAIIVSETSGLHTECAPSVHENESTFIYTGYFVKDVELICVTDFCSNDTSRGPDPRKYWLVLVCVSTVKNFGTIPRQRLALARWPPLSLLCILFPWNLSRCRCHKIAL
jgi:hypothetical protein